MCAALKALDVDTEFSPYYTQVDSGVHAQPYGDLETIHGALKRATKLAKQEPGAFVIAFENGVVWRSDHHVDLAYVVVVDPVGRVTIRHTDSVSVPDELVAESLASGWTVTCGQIEAQRSGCDPADPHVVWSGGTTNRLELLTATATEALRIALGVA